MAVLLSFSLFFIAKILKKPQSMALESNKYSKNGKTRPFSELYNHRRCATYGFSYYRRPRIIKGSQKQMP